MPLIELRSTDLGDGSKSYKALIYSGGNKSSYEMGSFSEMLKTAIDELRVINQRDAPVTVDMRNLDIKERAISTILFDDYHENTGVKVRYRDNK